MNISALLHEAVKRYKTKTAVIEKGRNISYQDLWNTIERLSSAFSKIGIKEKQRVALLLPNSAEFIYCFFSLLRNNVIVSPLSTDCTPYELKSIIDNLKPHAIISLPILIEKILSDSPSLLDNKILILQSNADISGKMQKHHELKDLYGLQKNYTRENVSTSIEHIATINYTYRGIGHPLGAVFTHGSYAQGVLAYIEGTRMSSEQRVLSLLPLHHFYPLVGCVLAPLVSGATVIISTNYMPMSILKTIENFRVDMFTSVPTIYRLLLRHYKRDDCDLSSLTCCITGGAYMPVETQKAVKTVMGLELLQGYGLTECFVAAWNRPGYNRQGTLGLPFTNPINFKIVDENGVNRGFNSVGEIVISSPAMMSGYYNLPEETQNVLKDGWLFTGDYGYLDTKGYLYYSGLKKNVVKVGGNMVDLQEVKEVLLSHPAISDATVCSKEDDLWGHIVTAVLLSRASADVSEKEIKAFCSKRLSQFKVPKLIQIRPVGVA
jgi:long-chain acyl-CoA synthetase